MTKSKKSKRALGEIRQKCSKKTKQIRTMFGLDKTKSRALFVAVAEAAGVKGALYLDKVRAHQAFDRVAVIFRNPVFQTAVRDGSYKARLGEFCTVKRPTVGRRCPDPVLPPAEFMVGKVGCGKGATQLYTYTPKKTPTPQNSSY